MKNRVAYKNQTKYAVIINTLTKHSLLPFKLVLPLYRKRSPGLWKKPIGWFLQNGNIGLKSANP